MLARPLLIGVMALLTVPSVHARQPQQPNPWRSLLVVDRLSDDITALDVSEIGMDGIPRYLSVDLQGHVGTVGTLAGLPIQVWLLRADGTTVTQQQTPSRSGGFQSIPPTDDRRFTFAPVPANELSGVVVSENGKLYVREIKANPTPW
jgi:hypothetical protein